MSDPQGAGDATRATTATYDAIATDFAARWSDSAVLADARARFAALLPPAARVLDVGCGPGRDAASLAATGLRVAGLDRSGGMLREARRRAEVPLLLGDMRRLPVRDGALDGLWVAASFLHLPKDEGPAALAEYRRALRPSGALYLGVQEGDGERWAEAAQYGRPLRRFFAYYREAELDALLGRAGFRVRDGWTATGHPHRWINRLAVAGPG